LKTELGKRVSALEQKAGLSGESIEVILRTFVSPGPNGPVRSEPRAIVGLAQGWRVDREQGESAADFLRRAMHTAPRTPGCIPRLVEELA